MTNLTINKVNVHCHVAGEGAGEPVLLLHCSSSTHSQWWSLWNLLEANFEVWAPDLYGYGGTDLWTGGSENLIEEEAKLIRGLIDKIGAPVHLVGHSIGGVISLRVAMEDPSLLKSLVLIEPVAAWLLEGDQDLSPYLEFRDIRNEFHSRFAAGDIDAAVLPYYDYWSGAGAWGKTEGKLREYVLATAEKVGQEFAAIYNSDNMFSPLENIDLPTTIIRGADTPSPTRRIADILSFTWPHASLHTIPDAGHLSPISHPAEVNELIKNHLIQQSIPVSS